MRILLITFLIPFFSFSQGDSVVIKIVPGVLDGVYIPEYSPYENLCRMNADVQKIREKLYSYEIPERERLLIDTVLCNQCPECFISYVQVLNKYKTYSYYKGDPKNCDSTFIYKKLLELRSDSSIYAQAGANYLLYNFPFKNIISQIERLEYLEQYVLINLDQKLYDFHFFNGLFSEWRIKNALYDILLGYHFHGDQVKTKEWENKIPEIYEKLFKNEPPIVLMDFYQASGNEKKEMELYEEISKIKDKHGKSFLSLDYFLIKYLNGNGDLFDFKDELKISKYEETEWNKDDFDSFKIKQKGSRITIESPIFPSLNDTNYFVGYTSKQDLIYHKKDLFELFQNNEVWWREDLILRNGKVVRISLSGKFSRITSSNYFINIGYDKKGRLNFVHLISSQEKRYSVVFEFKNQKIKFISGKKKLKPDSEKFYQLKEEIIKWGLQPWFEKTILSKIK